MTSQVNTAAADSTCLGMGMTAAGCCNGLALALCSSGVAAHRGQALLGVVAGGAYWVDDWGRLGRALGLALLGVSLDLHADRLDRTPQHNAFVPCGPPRFVCPFVLAVVELVLSLSILSRSLEWQAGHDR